MSVKMYDKFATWLQDNLSFDPPSDNIRAFNLGIFETHDGFCVYLIGAYVYTENDDSWACVEDYAPKDKYFCFLFLDITQRDYQFVETLVSNWLLSFLSSENSAKYILFNAKALTCGFDDGDLIVVHHNP